MNRQTERNYDYQYTGWHKLFSWAQTLCKSDTQSDKKSERETDTERQTESDRHRQTEMRGRM